MIQTRSGGACQGWAADSVGFLKREDLLYQRWGMRVGADTCTSELTVCCLKLPLSIPWRVKAFICVDRLLSVSSSALSFLDTLKDCELAHSICSLLRGLQALTWAGLNFREKSGSPIDGQGRVSA